MAAGKRVVPASFKEAGIALAARSDRRYMLLGIEGETGTGKSEMVLSAPDPIFVLNYDNGLRLLVDKHLDEGWDKVVGIHTVKLSPTINQDKDKESFLAARKKFMAAAKDPAVRTLAVDTGKQLWEHIRRAEFGKLVQVPQYRYPAANAAFRWFVDTADYYGKNFIMTFPMSDEYVKAEKRNAAGEKSDVEMKTGRRIRAGKGDAEEMVELHIRMEKDREIPEVPDKFSITIQKCRHDSRLEGTRLEGMVEPEVFSFVGLAMRVFEGSSEKDWGV